MADVGAPVGNQNAAKGKEFRQALKRVLARRHGSVSAGLEKVAEKLLDAVEASESWAAKEVADRFDGKPAQAIIGGDEDDPAIQVLSRIERVIRRADPTDSNV